MHTKLLHQFYQFTARVFGMVSSTRARTYVPLASVVLVIFALPMVALAATQGYRTTDTSIGTGMVVGLASNQANEGDNAVFVEKSTIAKADTALGVVVNPGDDLVTVSTSGDQVYVANSGLAQVFVTDINGTIKVGDLLAPSPIEGVLMRSTEGSKGIIGAAQDNFPENGTQPISVKNETGETINAQVALIRINMDVKFSTSNQSDGKSLLQRIGESLARRPVSTTQVVVAMVILTVLLLVEGSIVYGAISSSIISLGRNPLAKRTIMRGLGQITILVFIVLAIGLGAAYLVLWI